MILSSNSACAISTGALTALSLGFFGSVLVIAKLKNVISILPIIPYASFICYFILAVVAYVIKNVLVAKVGGGTFALSILLLVSLSIYLCIMLGVFFVRLIKSEGGICKSTHKSDQ